MRDKYEEELKKLNSSISQMGKMIELAIESSVISLMGRDIESAKAVRLNDYAINDMEREIENQCMKLLLQQQPMAGDLRTITAALKMITDMERIGDHAAAIADLVLQLPDFTYNKMSEISDMSTEIINMIHDCVISFVEKDYDKAKNVIVSDDKIDELYHSIKSDLIEKIKKTEEGEQLLDYFLIAKYLERIGDHATNIAEWVIFALTGKKEIRQNEGLCKYLNFKILYSSCSAAIAFFFCCSRSASLRVSSISSGTKKRLSIYEGKTESVKKYCSTLFSFS